VYEQQNNEAQALRSWREALDQIYYHNAYRVPSSYVARSETEKALQDSLRSMELQCKERVDLLEALKKSRDDAADESKAAGPPELPSRLRKESPAGTPKATTDRPTWLGGDTVAPANYSDIPRPSPPVSRAPLPSRPSYLSKKGSGDDMHGTNSSQTNSGSGLVPPTSQPRRGSRTPSPEKRGGMLKTLRKEGKERKGSSGSGKMATTLRQKAPTAASSAASQVWAGQRPSMGSSMGSSEQSQTTARAASSTNLTWDPYTRSLVETPPARRSVDLPDMRTSDNSVAKPPSPRGYLKTRHSNTSLEESHRSRPARPPLPYPDDPPRTKSYAKDSFSRSDESFERAKKPPVPPPHHSPMSPPPPRGNATAERTASAPQTMAQAGLAQPMTYMREFPNHPHVNSRLAPEIAIHQAANLAVTDNLAGFKRPKPAPPISRKAVSRAAGVVNATAQRQRLDSVAAKLEDRKDADPNSPLDTESRSARPTPRRAAPSKITAQNIPTKTITPPASDGSHESDDAGDFPSNALPTDKVAWDKRVKHIMKNLPKGVDEAAAKQIFNEIVIKGDEVHWDDVAGLEIAKSALKETVVYPFLRPDLFMGLREPARGMLLFGPPGTGKTMLARAVATESKSIFFAISASSLTSKFLGESEKLVRALFSIAKELAPSIIFVDEIDSLLGARGGGSEHEATRRIKTEFLIQWSDLQKAAAGREEKNKEKGDASRVLVLAATNLPWAIDEAARRRFVRRQYIPLPEDWVRTLQLRNLLAAQKHNIHDAELAELVHYTDGKFIHCISSLHLMLTQHPPGFSGSDITALAKDAAMGPLRSLGEKLLHMSPEDIRPIGIEDFRASLINIRPSVSKQGLKEFEDWAREFGERGG
jgi:SpoVK/Ycf46/Vps4 family AAA+-type ATPase